MIFDLDGTLIDSSEGIVHAVSEALRNLNYPILDEELIKSFIGPPIGKEIVKELGYGERELKEFNTEFRHLYKTKYLMEATIYPGIEDLLTRLLDQKFMAVATNKRIDYTLTLMEGLGLSKYFKIIEGSDFEGMLEKRDMINKCLKLFKSASLETVVVGDTINDALAARACGVDFIGVTYGMGFKKPEDVPFGKAATSVSSLSDSLF